MGQIFVSYHNKMSKFSQLFLGSRVLLQAQGNQNSVFVLHGGGDPHLPGEVKYGGSPHLSCKRDQIKMRDYMDKRATLPKWVTSPT